MAAFSKKATRRPSNTSAPSLALVATVVLHRSYATQQTCRGMRAQLPGHLSSSGAHPNQRRETRVVVVHSTISTPHRGGNNTERTRAQQRPALHSTVSQPTHTRTITQMCAAITVAHHAPPALPPLTHDTAIQRPAARAPFRLPPFKTPTCFPSTHRYSNKAASAPGQLGLRQLGDAARQVSTLAPRAERRKSHGDGDLFGLVRMASSARHLASAGGPRAFDQTGINRSETRLSVNAAPSLHTQCSTANAIKDHSPAALLASRVLVQCTQITCRSVGCLHRGRHVGQCLISCAAATHRKTKLPAGKWYTLSQRSADTHCWTKGQPCHGDSKTQKA
ncbi:hypothetical protein, conserved in T. vivax [Trypanosoma vivax Y486]|uniref:Uncharacterized protein n=1 Tax=Trypanosoma vivax (strain Y486) TaxID=1055687 RepID=F9WRD7_TRYVY|nr:hypothetical protein, conserved in T. vivax [Trypanosoma vivax Y486]|eukprot:CCD20121.1 hypothetical protein, conserved in T. vivax [Trypanosoma vivax Y486]